MHNTEIRNAAAAAGVRLYEIAAVIGCNDGNFSRKLRFELPDAEKARILGIIDDLAASKRGGVADAEEV